MGNMKRQRKLQKKWVKRAALSEQPPASVYKMKIFEVMLAHQMNHYLRKLTITEGEKILAVGCFNGRVLHKFDEKGIFKGFYADQSPRLMMHAMHIYPHFSYRLLNERGIDFKDYKFHRTMMSIPVQSFADEHWILSELKRVTKKTGKIYVCSALNHSLEPQFSSVGLKISSQVTVQRINIYELIKVKTLPNE